MTPTTALGLSIRLSMFELRETGDWDIFPGPPERARAETGGADQWLLKRRECSGLARVNKATSAYCPALKGVDSRTQDKVSKWIRLLHKHPAHLHALDTKNAQPQRDPENIEKKYSIAWRKGE